MILLRLATLFISKHIDHRLITSCTIILLLHLCTSFAIAVEPVVTINIPSDGDQFALGETITFSGFGLDTEDGPINDGTALVWTSSTGTLGSGSLVLSDALPAGTLTINLIITDSEGEIGFASVTITIGNTDPTAQIDFPATDSTFSTGEYINFVGSGTDEEDISLPGTSLSWISNKDGVIGNGTSLTLNNLTEGMHEITLTVVDSQGSINSDTITLVIGNTPPTATITSPEDQEVFADTDTITFLGSGTDNEDGNLTGDSLVWTSSLDEIIATGITFDTDSLSRGVHTITLTVTDNDDSTDFDSIIVNIQNSLPVISIITPEDDEIYDEGESIIFSATCVDTEDGTLEGNSLIWVSSIDNIIGTGSYLSADFLSGGSHIITLTATDSDSGLSSNAVDIVVTSMIATPTTLSLAEGESGGVVISGGTPPYDSFIRYSQFAKCTISGNSVTITGKATGKTAVTLTDSRNKMTVVDVTITSAHNISPIADIMVSAEIVNEGSTVTLNGYNSYDMEDGPVTFYNWSRKSGPYVKLVGEDPAIKTFTAPFVGAAGATIVFELTVSDSNYATSTDNTSILITDNTGETNFSDDTITFTTATQKIMGISTIGETTILDIDLINGSSIIETTNRPGNLIYGLLELQLKVDTPGGLAITNIYLPEPAPAGYKWYKYNSDTGWIDFDRATVSGNAGDGAVFNSDRTIVTLFVIDDGSYDDNKTDLIIKDPSGLGTPPPNEASRDSNKGGCFLIQSR